MTDWLAAIRSPFAIAEAAGVALAVAYLVLAVRQNILCWAAALASTVLYTAVFFDARLYMESALQVFYAAMAIYGWRQWRYAGAEGAGVSVHTWTLRRHCVVVGAIVVAAGLLGWGMARTDAAFPYLDALTTVAAIVTTFMVARKVLENWLYWFVIDSISICLYMARELYPTALLFVLYLVLIVIGYRRWRRDYLADGRRRPHARDRTAYPCSQATNSCSRPASPLDRPTRAANRETHAANRETHAADRQAHSTDRRIRTANQRTRATGG